MVVFAITSSPVFFREMIYVHVHIPFLSLGMQCDIVLSQRPLSYASQLKGVLHTIICVYQVEDTLDEVRRRRGIERKETKLKREGEEEESVRVEVTQYLYKNHHNISMRFCVEMRAKKNFHTPRPHPPCEGERSVGSMWW